jgi:RNA polymerase sigma-70 factor (ECF subfamily)
MKVIQLHKNEKVLIQSAQKQDRKAQLCIYNLYAPKMLSVCRYYIRDISEAEEAMLGGFLKVFKSLNTYRFEGSFEGWIRKIMVRTCISELRKKSKIEFVSEYLDHHTQDSNIIDNNLAVDEIQQLIDALPNGYKLVFVMYAIEGYKHSEIAKELKISEGTSKSQLFKARQMLQQQVVELNKSSYGTS